VLKEIPSRTIGLAVVSKTRKSAREEILVY